MRLRAVVIAALSGSLAVTAATPSWADDIPDTSAPIISSTGLTEGQLAPAVLNFFPVVSDDIGVVKIDALLNNLTTAAACRFVTAKGWSCRALMNQVADDSDATVTVRAFDATGKSSELTTTVHIDKTPPQHTISPAVGTAMRSGPAEITVGAAADTAKIEVTEGLPGAVLATITAAPWTYTWAAGDGKTPPCVRLTDKAGNTSGTCSKYIVDDDAPVIERVVNAAAYSTNVLDTGTGWVGGFNHVQSTITDESTIAKTEWRVNGALSSTDPMFYWNTTAVKTPTATVEIRVWDAVGHTASKSFLVNIDKAPPAMTVSPAERKLIRGSSFVTTAKATDPHGIAYTMLQGRDASLGTGTSVRVDSGRDGLRTVTWLSNDKLDNYGYTKRTVIIDNTAPALTIKKAPKNNTRLKAKFSVTAATSDRNGIAKVQVLVNGKVVGTDTKSAYTFTLNPKKYGKKFTVQLRAYDKAGNVKTSTKRTYRR
jgi:hypothetical protein